MQLGRQIPMCPKKRVSSITILLLRMRINHSLTKSVLTYQTWRCNLSRFYPHVLGLMGLKQLCPTVSQNPARDATCLGFCQVHVLGLTGLKQLCPTVSQNSTRDVTCLGFCQVLKNMTILTMRTKVPTLLRREKRSTGKEEPSTGH